MKIVSFTMVNNEAEIIESFVRYNYNFVNQMVIIDNGCTDNTIQIIRNLKREGYNIDIYDESLEVYDQFRLDNKYLEKIIYEYDADIILPLDADEFISGDSNPHDLLEKLDLNAIYYVNWNWYVLTGKENYNIEFIPNRIQYRLEKKAWNFSDGTPVTKVIIPAKYYKENHLTLTMGHHDVFGNEKIKKVNLNNLWIAHYRAISSRQIVSKTMTYTIRDIATMSNNIETAQRTNQLYDIKYGNEGVELLTQHVSYGGYTGNIIFDPLNLKFCDSNSLTIKYDRIARESIQDLLMKTGQEMAIRSYNLEKKYKNKSLLKPILFWLDKVQKNEIIYPSPSMRLNVLTMKYNVQAYVTDYKQIEFLKYNYRLLVNPNHAKFLPYKYIIITDDDAFDSIKKKLVDEGIEENKILSLNQYKHKLGIIGNIYANLCLMPGLISRARNYIKRNGLSHTIYKLKNRRVN